MERIRQWSYILTTFALLISGCQSSQAAVNVDNPTTSGEIPSISALIDSISLENSNAGEIQNNECLNCHSNKDRLIETAEPEKPIEIESKGVG